MLAAAAFSLQETEIDPKLAGMFAGCPSDLPSVAVVHI
jgi:hypothetical protein